LAAAFVVLSRLYLGDGRPGVVAAALAVLGHVQLEFWHTAQPESFGAPLVAWGLALAAFAMEREQRWLWMAAGLCFGAATLLKPTIGLAGAAPLVVAWTRSGRRARFVEPFLLGGIVPAAICFAFFNTRRGLPELADALLQFAPQYASLAWQR